MNYFAHLHLAYLSNTSLTGNLLGDFVKGSRLSYLPRELELGIRLHRSIDSYTDSHYVSQQFKSEFREMRRYAGVGLDILFDHLLAKQLGSQYTPLCQQFYQILLDENVNYNAILPSDYQHKTRLITSNDWFASYSNLSGITLALKNTGKRFRKPVALEKVLNWYIANQADVDNSFKKLYYDTTQYTFFKRDELNDRLISV